MSEGIPVRQARGTEQTEFFQSVIAGSQPSVGAWYEYLDLFHASMPLANEALFTSFRTLDGRSSYDVLAEKAAAEARGPAVLDIGCGCGTLITSLLDHFPPDARFTGVDLCEAEIQVARSAFVQQSSVSMRQAFAAVLPFEDASFDIVVSHQVFNFMPDLVQVLRETARVLRPGGALVFSTNRGWQAPESRECSWVYLADVAARAFEEAHPKSVAPLIDDRRIYSDGGIAAIFNEAAAFDTTSLRIERYVVGADLIPDKAVEMRCWTYVQASSPQSDRILAAVRAKAVELCGGGDTFYCEIPFRLVSVRKPA
jgi:ubiquinone/menaquinone biosynthesis C-methylase UbiE